MAKVVQGNLIATGRKFAIVASRFNEFITKKLVEGAEDNLTRHGADANDITLVWVPGAFELPVVAQKLAESKLYDAVLCLGAVLRGQTPHFDYVAGEAAKGIAQVGLKTGVPTIFGVVTADTLEQAIDRAGTKAGNRGADAAATAIELVSLFGQLQ